MVIPVKSKTDNAMDNLLDEYSEKKNSIDLAASVMNGWQNAAPSLKEPFDAVRKALGLEVNS